jgi:mRNA interferase HigB
MHVIARRPLIDFWKEHPDAEGSLKAWYHEADKANWHSGDDIKRRYATASILNRERVVFNIRGNSYRLVVRINYASQTIFVRFIGTHEQYNDINAETI